MPIRARLRHLTPIVVVALAGLGVGACDAFTLQTPKPTPTDFAGIVAELDARGILVDNVTSGDAGCDDQRLARTAIGFDAQGAGQDRPLRVHLYAFKTQAVFDELRPEVDLCARSYVSDPAAYSSVAAAPYVLAGDGPWPAPFADALRGALESAAVGG